MKIKKIIALLFVLSLVLLLVGHWFPPALFLGIGICFIIMAISFGFCRYCDEFDGECKCHIDTGTL